MWNVNFTCEIVNFACGIGISHVKWNFYMWKFHMQITYIWNPHFTCEIFVCEIDSYHIKKNLIHMWTMRQFVSFTCEIDFNIWKFHMWSVPIPYLNFTWEIVREIIFLVLFPCFLETSGRPSWATGSGELDNHTLCKSTLNISLSFSQALGDLINKFLPNSTFFLFFFCFFQLEHIEMVTKRKEVWAQVQLLG
jgi:hypothetical protein